MNREMIELVRQFDRRPISEDDKETMLSYSRSVPLRIEAVQAVQAIEHSAIEEAVRQLQRNFASMEQRHVDPWDRTRRDMAIMLRVCCQGMLLDDFVFIEQRLIIWLRTMLTSSNVPMDAVNFAYTTMINVLKTKLKKPHADLIIPVIQKSLDVLCEAPAPVLSTNN